MLKLLEYLKDYRQYLPIILTIIGFLTGNQGLENLNIIRAAEAPPELGAYGNVAGHGLVSFALFVSALLMSRKKPESPESLHVEMVAVGPTSRRVSDVEFCEMQRRLYDVFSEDQPARNACLSLWQRFYALNFSGPKPPAPEPVTPVPAPEPAPSVPSTGGLDLLVQALQQLSQPSQTQPKTPTPTPATGKDASNDVSKPAPAPARAAA